MLIQVIGSINSAAGKAEGILIARERYTFVTMHPGLYYEPSLNVDVESCNEGMRSLNTKMAAYRNALAPTERGTPNISAMTIPRDRAEHL